MGLLQSIRLGVSAPFKIHIHCILVPHKPCLFILGLTGIVFESAHLQSFPLARLFFFGDLCPPYLPETSGKRENAKVFEGFVGGEDGINEIRVPRKVILYDGIENLKPRNK